MQRLRNILSCAVLVYGMTGSWQSQVADASVPQQINHQGVVRVNGVPFTGTGLFKFAIVDPDSGNNLWTNDGTNEGTALEPTAAVGIDVAGGVYSAALGDTTITNMTAIPTSVFNDDNAVLRIWFDDGVNGNQQLAPDHTLTPAPYAHRAATGVPVGTIVAFAGLVAPDGWLICDGSTKSRTTFADLFAAIGTSWGAGDGSTFHLPDLRGRFLRGVDAGAGRDPDVLTRTASNAGGNTGDAVGSLQSGATAMPNAAFATQSSGSHSHSGNAGNSGGAGAARPLVGFNSAAATYNTNGTPNHSHTITGGDSETRPINVNVHWIIKY